MANMIPKGYDEIYDDKTGRILNVERATGEVYDTINVTIPVGSVCYTPEQQRSYKERKDRESKKCGDI